MQTLRVFTIILGLISLSCSGSKQTIDTNVSIQKSSTKISETGKDKTDIWLNQPNARSSKIKVLNASIAFSSLPNSLTKMGYTITENTGTSLMTNAIRAESDYVRVKAWVEGLDIILASEVQQFTETEFGFLKPTGFESCTKGDSTPLPDCWRVILIIANHFESEKQYQ